MDELRVDRIDHFKDHHKRPMGFNNSLLVGFLDTDSKFYTRDEEDKQSHASMLRIPKRTRSQRALIEPSLGGSIPVELRRLWVQDSLGMLGLLMSAAVVEIIPNAGIFGVRPCLWQYNGWYVSCVSIGVVTESMQARDTATRQPHSGVGYV